MKRRSSLLVVLLIGLVRPPLLASQAPGAAPRPGTTSPETAAPLPRAQEDAPAEAPRGKLLIVGGGGTGPLLLARGLEESGGRGKARVAVFGQASSLADSGAKSAEMWREAGAAEAHAVDLSDLDAARALVERSTLIWFSGGDQSRLVAALAPTGLVPLVRARYFAGALVGGTSAGAAVMSRVMITGDYAGQESDQALAAVRAGVVQTKSGFGLMPEAIVDQHFLKRRRFHRLLAAVIEHPTLVGIGIDERTAILLSGSTIEVLGESSVLVIDPRGAAHTIGDAERARDDAERTGEDVRGADRTGALLSASGLALTLLVPGDKLDLAAGRAR